MGLGILKNVMRCPRKLLTPETIQVMNIFTQCYSNSADGLQLSNLPSAGGVLDQPHTLMQAMSIIASTVIEIWKKERPNG